MVSDNDASFVDFYGRPFYEELEDLQYDAPPMKFALISAGRKMQAILEITHFHKFGRGSGLAARPLDQWPEVPFLFTDQVDAKIIWNTEVSVQLTPEAESIFKRNAPYTVDYPVETDAWFGMLALSTEERFYFLTAFSKHPDAQVLHGQNICFTEWGDSRVAGTVSS